MNRTSTSAVALACLALLACTGARAESNPWYVGVSESLTYDSNIYRLPDTVPAIGVHGYSTALHAGLDQNYGRQHFLVDASASDNRYASHGELNNTGYGADARWDFEALDKLGGRLHLVDNRNLAQYGALTGFTQKNIEHNQDYNLEAHYGLVGLLSIQGTAGHRALSYSANEYQIYDFSQDSYSLGLRWRPSGLLTLGIDGRTTSGEFPHNFGASGTSALTFRRNDVDLTATWNPSAQSSLFARVSFSRQRYNDLAARDLNGTTGALAWDYQPTGKLHFTTKLTRDTGLETGHYFFTFFGQPITGDASRVATGAQVKADYAATGKISLNGSLQYIKRSLSGLVLPGDTGTDETSALALGVTYTPLRSLQLGCQAMREQRHSTALTNVSYPYKANSASCTAQFTLQ